MKTQFIILGSGSSMGVPTAAGNFGNCNSKNKKNYRTRCSALIKFNSKNFLIDTSPDLRQQMISNRITSVKKVFYTHFHADQTHGINDLRSFYLKEKKKIPVYADTLTTKYLYSTFKYCFKSNSDYPSILALNKLKKKYIFKDKNKKILIDCVTVKHGNVNSICYIINKKLAYASDISLIYKKDLRSFKNLVYLVVDCLWYKKHISHYNLDDVLNLVKIIKPKKVILTNMHNVLDYDKIKKNLPSNIVPGYDGMTLNL